MAQGLQKMKDSMQDWLGGKSLRTTKSLPSLQMADITDQEPLITRYGWPHGQLKAYRI